MKSNILIVWALLFTTSVVSAQVCDGNLGENIFTAGDFGSGPDNVIPGNPNIAPGYNYTALPPPNDGSYTITNNSGAWPNIFPSWLQIPDNSNDPNGYFMVVNASFDPGLFYEQTINGLCDNTLYSFKADIINMIQQNVADHILPNVSFLLDGVEQFSTGEVPQSTQWITYGFSFTTAPGQTEVTLALRNNAPGGNGNDLGLDNITFQACGPEALILPETALRICEDGVTTLEATINGNQYPTPAVQWQRSLDNGQTWVDIPGANALTLIQAETGSGFYFYRYLLANSPTNLANNRCRVVSNIRTVEIIPKRWMVTDTICQGLTYFTGNSSYDQTGIYIDTLISSLGCDSIATLDLTVIADPNVEADISVISPDCLDGAGSISIDTVRNGNPEYIYSITNRDSTVIGGPLFSNISPNSYSIRVEDRHGCLYEESRTITEPDNFFLELGADQSVPLGQTVRINVIATDSIDSFFWTPEIPGCGPDCPNPVFVPTESQVYRLDALSTRGCTATDSIRIGVQKIRQVYLPNAFSPNGDGINDDFLPFVGEPNVQSIVSMQVFNRWGGLVFDGGSVAPNTPVLGWDGFWNGKQAEAGTYVYRIAILFLDGETVNYAGEVMLLR